MVVIYIATAGRAIFLLFSCNISNFQIHIIIVKPFNKNRKANDMKTAGNDSLPFHAEKEESEMFDGFGLFGTGIGTGFFGKVEDLMLGAGCAVTNAKNKLEEVKYRDKKRKTQIEDQEFETDNEEPEIEERESGIDEGNVENIP